MPAVVFDSDGSASRGVVITGNVLRYQQVAVAVEGPVFSLVISGNRIYGGGVTVTTDSFRGTISGNIINAASAEVAAIDISADLDGDVSIEGNHIWGSIRHGIHLADGPDNEGAFNATIANNHIDSTGSQTANTYDAIHVSGAASRNYIHGNKIVPSSVTRYGINMAGSGDCNVIVGNDLGDPDDYGTDAMAPGSGNILTYPNDPTYGDNFTGCPTSPSSP